MKNDDWRLRPRKVSIVVDNPSWVLPYCQELVERINAGGDSAQLCLKHNEIQCGDIAVFIGCVKITPADMLARNRCNLVAHASDLPHGRGFSPMTWQIIEAKSLIPLCLIEAGEGVDTGPVVLRDELCFHGHELLEDLRVALGQAQINIVLRYLAQDKLPESRPQIGECSYYARRYPRDSQLDPDVSIADQFNLLRVVDNEKYPAFFELKGHHYKLAISKMPKELTPPSPVKIGERLIGPDYPPYVVAEMSGNHNGDLDRALKLIEAAAEAGADAVKLQTYTADTITLDHNGPDFIIEGGLWHNRTLYDLYEEAHTPWEWHEVLFKRGRDLGIEVFSSPFDPTAVDLLQGLDVQAYKIASFELTDFGLIRRCAETGKPLIMSTGMANCREITEAIDVARGSGCEQLILLHCVSGYPTEPKDAHLNTLPDLSKRFNVIAGLSDHTHGTAVSVASVALGANFIEKHFTLCRADGGPDAVFSLEPKELKELVEGCRVAWNALGRVHYDLKGSEQGNQVFRRSLYVVTNVEKGEPFTVQNIRSIRPGFGIAPKYLDNILGRTATRALTRGEPLGWDMIEGNI